VVTMGIVNEIRVQRVMPEPTTRVRVSATDELDVWVMGEGDPMVLIHGGMARDLLEPLADELAGMGGYRAIHYGRRGHGGVGLPGEAADIPGQAIDVVTILDALGIDKAHVVGHSFGADIAVELATRMPDRLVSTTLLEAPFAQTDAMQQSLKDLGAAMSLIADTYTNGDADGAVTTFWEFTSEVEGVAALLEPVLPEGARQLAAVDLGTWLRVDLPAMGAWMADPAAVRAITTPIAWIGATDSAPIFTESRALLQRWLPTTRAATIVGVGHYFPVLKPAETAATLAELLRSATPAQ
jgi:pimeloyl-ACP methyl ester carboxylesterase